MLHSFTSKSTEKGHSLLSNISLTYFQSQSKLDVGLIMYSKKIVKEM